MLRMPVCRMYRRRMEHHERVLSSLQHGGLAPRLPLKVPVTPRLPVSARGGSLLPALSVILLPRACSGSPCRHTTPAPTGTARRAWNTLWPCRPHSLTLRACRRVVIPSTTSCVGDGQAGRKRFHASASVWQPAERLRLPYLGFDTAHRTPYGALVLRRRTRRAAPSKISSANPAVSVDSVGYHHQRLVDLGLSASSLPVRPSSPCI